MLLQKEALASLAFIFIAAVPPADGTTFFRPPALLCNSSARRLDPALLTLAVSTASPRGTGVGGSAHTGVAAVARACATGAEGGGTTEGDAIPWKISVDGGASWRPAPAAVAAHAPDGWIDAVAFNDTNGAAAAAGALIGIPQGYLAAATRGPFLSKGRDTYTANLASGIVATFDPAARSEWAALPRPVGLFAPGSGGVTALDNSGKAFLATPWIWYADSAIVEPGKRCCNGSVVAYVTEDRGATWEFVSTVAAKKSLPPVWSSEEGPNENDVVLLKDKRTILAVIRKDGGDGVPHHRHAPYFFATSTDRGRSWELKEAPPFMLAARPRALVLPNGVLVIAGGRPALNMWVSEDGYGKSWEVIDIPAVHNELTTDPSRRFCPAFVNATAGLGWEQSSCYTQLGALSRNSGLVCYQRQGAASGGTGTPPPECRVAGTMLFCMRFTVGPA